MVQSSFSFDDDHLPVLTLAEARRRGLDVDASIKIRHQRVIGALGGAVAHFNWACEQAAAEGIEVTATAHHQDGYPTSPSGYAGHSRRPRTAQLTARVRHVDIDERV